MIYIHLEIKENPDGKNTYTIKNVSGNKADIGELGLSYASREEPAYFKFSYNIDYNPSFSKVIGNSVEAKSTDEDLRIITGKIVAIIENQLKKNKSLQDRAADALAQNPKFFKPENASDAAKDKVKEAQDRLHPHKK